METLHMPMIELLTPMWKVQWMMKFRIYQLLVNWLQYERYTLDVAKLLLAWHVNLYLISNRAFSSSSLSTMYNHYGSYALFSCKGSLKFTKSQLFSNWHIKRVVHLKRCARTHIYIYMLIMTKPNSFIEWLFLMGRTDVDCRLCNELRCCNIHAYKTNRYFAYSND